MENGIKIPTSRNGKATFKLLVESAITTFYKKGYSNTVIVDITKNAGVATGTFYLYFANKKSLYIYLLEYYQHEIRKAIAEKTANVEGFSKNQRIGIKTFFQYAIKHPEAYNIIWESLYIDKSLFKKYYHDFALRYQKGLDASIEKGEIKKIDSDILAYILMGISNFLGLKLILKMGNRNKLDYLVDQAMVLIDSCLIQE